MPDIISRAEAKEKGFKRFFLGRPCKFGHISEFYVTNGYCVECQRLHQHTEQYRTRQRELAKNRKLSKEQRLQKQARAVTRERLKKQERDAQMRQAWEKRRQELLGKNT